MWVGHTESRAGLATDQGWDLVGPEEDPFWPTPPHKSGMPSWSGDLEHCTTLHYKQLKVN